MISRILPNTRVLCDGMKGQNYWFNGCMEYLMECLGESPDYNYWFFSGVTGDTFTQIYSQDPTNMVLCYTHNLLDQAINKAFDACGYHFNYISSVDDRDRKQYDEQIKESIDQSVPVIAKTKDAQNQDVYGVICGYDDAHFYYLIGDCADARVNANKYSALVFVGERKERPALSEVYKRMVLDIPTYLSMPSTEQYSFGKQAFIDWAQSFQNGSLNHISIDDKGFWYTHGDPAFSCWNMHGTYLCMLGTNACIDDCLKKALAFNPEITFIHELLPLYKKQAMDGFHALIGMQGGFSIKPETVKDKELMRPISDKIWELAGICDDILEVFTRVHPSPNE